MGVGPNVPVLRLRGSLWEEAYGAGGLQDWDAECWLFPEYGAWREAPQVVSALGKTDPLSESGNRKLKLRGYSHPLFFILWAIASSSEGFQKAEGRRGRRGKSVHDFPSFYVSDSVKRYCGEETKGMNKKKSLIIWDFEWSLYLHFFYDLLPLPMNPFAYVRDRAFALSCIFGMGNLN